MTNLFDVTAPCVIRLPSGEKKLMAEKFDHSEGLLYFELWWHQKGPDEAFHIINGELTGEGPWKIDDHVITVLGCEGTDPELSNEWSAWSSYIVSHVSDYPVPELVQAIARKAGAVISEE